MYGGNNPPIQIEAHNMAFVILVSWEGYTVENHSSINAMISYRLLHSIEQRPLLHFRPDYSQKIEMVEICMYRLWPLPTSTDLLLLEPTKLWTEVINRILLYNGNFYCHLNNFNRNVNFPIVIWISPQKCQFYCWNSNFSAIIWILIVLTAWNCNKIMHQ